MASIVFKNGSFQQMYAEAIQAVVMLQGYSTDMLQSCVDDDFSAARTNFGLADEYYKKANDLVAHLTLWHGARVSGKKLDAWTQEEREQNALIRALGGMISSVMNHLLTAYRPWLAKAQSALAEAEK